MQNFTDLDVIKTIDPQDTLSSTDMLPEQCKTAWNEVSAIEIPNMRLGIKNIVFCGMGASMYGALVLRSLLGKNLPYPMDIVSDYHLPDYVDASTLVVLTSYSGTTEEVLSCANEAKERNAKMVILTKGGPLAQIAKEEKIPAYIFDGKLNPSSVPRLGNGYTIFGLLGLLDKAGIVTLEDEEIRESFVRLQEKQTALKRQAQFDAEKFVTNIPIVITAEHLVGNGQIMRNQFNETSKTFSSYFVIPDLNHHLMEGLAFPVSAPLQFIVLSSPNYSDKIKKRVLLTKEVIEKNGHNVHEVATSGQTFYDDFLEVLWYGSYLTFYVALLHDQNPAINPWVDYFKNQLK